MSVSIYQLGYKKLSQIIFEWQAADRASLLALFMVIEVFFHWLWCLYVWLNKEALHDYVNLPYLYPLWIGITFTGLFFWWMVGQLSRIKNNDKDLKKWQIILIVPYTFYVAIIITMMGYSSLFAGVSLVGGAMLGMMLVKRLYIWRVFLVQVTMIVIAIIAPYFGIHLPNLRNLTVIYPLLENHSYLTYNEVMIIENTVAAAAFKNHALTWDNISNLQRSSAFFWRSTHVYLALPKAVFMVYVFRTLLLILDNSKNEILRHANQDELTVLDNRRSGLTKMRQALVTTKEAQDYSVILLDLDLFKNINDTYGHKVGDQVLFEVAQVLSNKLTDEAIISRYGGEEFLIILPNTKHDEALTTAEYLRLSIEQHTIETDEGAVVPVTASLGLFTLTHTELARIKADFQPSQLPASPSKFGKLPLIKSRKFVKPTDAILNAQLPNDICQRLISTADGALYKAKGLGRNRVVSAEEIVKNKNINALASSSISNSEHLSA